MTKAITFIGICVAAAVFSLNIFAQEKLPASSIKTIYITPTSHYDFGFVEAPDAVRERAARHIDEVLRVAESDPDFRWTIESVWQLNEWLKRQKKPTSVLPKDKEKIKELWNPMMKTWFTEGVNDTGISVIKVEPEEGYYWDTKHAQVIGLIKRMIGAAIGKTMDDSIEGTISI